VEIMWTEAVMASLEELSRYLPASTEETYEKLTVSQDG
jgi:hypothetical protein